MAFLFLNKQTNEQKPKKNPKTKPPHLKDQTGKREAETVQA